MHNFRRKVFLWRGVVVVVFGGCGGWWNAASAEELLDHGAEASTGDRVVPDNFDGVDEERHDSVQEDGQERGQVFSGTSVLGRKKKKCLDLERQYFGHGNLSPRIPFPSTTAGFLSSAWLLRQPEAPGFVGPWVDACDP